MAKLMNSFSLPTVVLLFLTFPNVSKSLKCVDDSTCTGSYGEFSYCENELCRCVDFYGIVGRTCVRAAKYGGRCTVNGECGIELGVTSSRCNELTKRCDCFDIMGESGYLNGKCHRLKSVGESCSEDEQCILGTNILSRCVNNICQCYSNENVTLVVGADGFCRCQVEDPAPVQCPHP